MPPRIGDASEMYTYLMCKAGDYVITAQNSQMIKRRKFNYDGYLVESEQECENFWKSGLEDKCLFSKKINILEDHGLVRLVEMVNEDDDDCSCYEDIDFKKFEFVCLQKIEAEIYTMNFKDLLKADINVYYPIFRLKS